MIVGIIILGISLVCWALAARYIYRLWRYKPDELMPPPESTVGYLDDDVVYGEDER